jgi:hypothetical protein
MKTDVVTLGGRGGGKIKKRETFCSLQLSDPKDK